jgi:hypothetical protein
MESCRSGRIIAALAGWTWVVLALVLLAIVVPAMVVGRKAVEFLERREWR